MGCDAPVCPHGRTSGPCPGCQQDYRIEDLEAEVERLQGIIDMDNGAVEGLSWDLDAARKEIDRLRKQDSDTADMLGLAIVELAESRDEVERLRGEQSQAWQEVRDNAREVERRLAEENERLRAALERIDADVTAGPLELKNIARTALAKEDK